MNTKQKPRERIILNLDSDVLKKITHYCKFKGLIRNKYLERLISQRFSWELNKVEYMG